MQFSVPLDIIPVIKKTKLSFQFSEKNDEHIFYDLCFCLCAPQTRFVYNREVQKKLIEIDFYRKNCETPILEGIVKKVRFFRIKASNLCLAKLQFPQIISIVRSDLSSQYKRSWMIYNVDGCGMKVASHFLRNLGCIGKLFV